jgi:hypothetical protein
LKILGISTDVITQMVRGLDKNTPYRRYIDEKWHNQGNVG